MTRNQCISQEIQQYKKELYASGGLARCDQISHHGNTSIMEHAVYVAQVSCQIADALHLKKIHRTALIRGALLHDYYLYDWHEADASHKFHGFRHPFTSLKNARNDYPLSKKEEEIIVKHMFPLVPIPPTCLEAWIVCIADKYCASREIINNKRHTERKISS